MQGERERTLIPFLPPSLPLSFLSPPLPPLLSTPDGVFHFLDTFEKESVTLKVSEFEANEEKKELEKALQEVSRGARSAGSAGREGGREGGGRKEEEEEEEEEEEMRGRERLDSRGSVSAPPQVRKRLADLKPKLNKPEEPVKQPVIGVLLNVKEKAEIQLLVSYIVSNASWTPKYDLRVSSKERTMEVRAGEGGRRGGREGGGGHLSLMAVVVFFLCRLATLGWSSRTLGKTGEPFCVCPLLLFLLLLLLLLLLILLLLLLLLLLLILPPLPPLTCNCIPTGWMPGSPSPQPHPASEAPPQN